MKLKKFDALFSQIISENKTFDIKINTFNYKFIIDDKENKTYCMFNSVDSYDNKLISIKATIFENNTYEFQVTKNNKKKIYTDKEFLLSYYKEYQEFKKALSEFKKEKLQQDISDNNDNNTNEIIDGKSMPKIKSFNDVLSDINNVEDGTLIKIDNTAFTFKTVDDQKYKNLITISFSFENPNTIRTQSDLQNYDAICLAKIASPYMKILNINLYNPEDLKETAPVKKLIESQFKTTFVTVYFQLKNAMQKYLTEFLIDQKF